MANADSTTNATLSPYKLPPEAVFNIPLADAIRHLDCDHLTLEETLALSFGCEDSLAGLYSTLNFMGNALVSLSSEKPVQFSPDSIHQLGKSLVCFSELIPALVQLEAKADQQLFASENIT